MEIIILVIILISIILYWHSNLKFKYFNLLVLNLCFYYLIAPNSYYIILLSLLFFVIAGQLITRTTGNLRSVIFSFTFFISLAFVVSYKQLLPGKSILGLSYFVFQSIWLISELFRNKNSNANEALSLSSVLIFFATITSGPIIKPLLLKREIEKESNFTWRQFEKSFFFIFVGILSKYFISSAIDEILIPNDKTLLSFAISNFLFYLKIYFDFYGYSLIAIGFASTIGISIPYNFNSPLLSNSPSDFWSRWHISLNQWTKENIFNPLLIYSQSTLLALVVSFLIISIWHAFNFIMLFWGILWILTFIIWKFVIEKTIANKNLKMLLMLVISTQLISPYRFQDMHAFLNTLRGLKLFATNGYSFSIPLLSVIGIYLLHDILNDKVKIYDRFINTNAFSKAFVLITAYYLLKNLTMYPNLNFFYSNY